MRDRRTLKGFLLSLLLHLLVFGLLVLSFKEIKHLPPSSSHKETKISLNLAQFTPPAPKPKPQKPAPKPPSSSMPIVPAPLKPTVQQKRAEKKIVRKEKSLGVARKAPKESNATKRVKKTPPKSKKKVAKTKPKKIQKKKQRIAKKKPLPTTFRLPKQHSKDKLASALMGSSKSTGRLRSHASGGSQTNRLIKQLYGKEFYSFTKIQKKFIKDHLSEIQHITQNTLVINGYPDVAVYTGQQGVNVVSFYLHPNGDISNLRLVKPMGYRALDQNTISVIQISYKDYPRPRSKTKIVFYVNYRLY